MVFATKLTFLDVVLFVLSFTIDPNVPLIKFMLKSTINVRGWCITSPYMRLSKWC